MDQEAIAARFTKHVPPSFDKNGRKKDWFSPPKNFCSKILKKKNSPGNNGANRETEARGEERCTQSTSSSCCENKSQGCIGCL